MSHTIDIIDVKQEIKMGRLEVIFHRGNILLRDTRNGEAVKIAKLPAKPEPNYEYRAPWQNCSNCGNRETKEGCNNCVSGIDQNMKMSIPSSWKPRTIECEEKVWLVTRNEAPFGYKYIAERCGCTLEDLLMVNNTDSSVPLVPGQRLKVPKKEEV